MRKILYISYDGMTDPLGQSQVINYLIGLTPYGYQFDILSFEKPEKYQVQGQYIQALLDKYHINWYPQVFHTTPPVLSKFFDKTNLIRTATKLHHKHKYDLIHCRSYISSEVGLKLKRKTDVKFLFDMRGFWADEKADGGAWNKNNWFWNKVYHFYKDKEKSFIREADHIIALTSAARQEIQHWDFYNAKIPITVIPCCVDTERFVVTDAEKKAAARKLLHFSPTDFVLSYLGSLGSWYMIDEMLLFFSVLKSKKPSAKFLIITNSEHEIITSKLTKYQLSINDFVIKTVAFKDVPSNMYASDVSISFIRPVYSKMSSSPVKIGEILSMGIPIIMNNIGDASHIKYDNQQLLVNTFTATEFMKIVDKINEIQHVAPQILTNIAIEMFDLKKGVNLYKGVYENLRIN